MVACVVSLAVVACTATAQPLPEVPLPSPTPAPPISFPRDAGPHDSLTEWWYFTGHLATPEGHPFGFEFVVFQVVRANQPTGYLAHFAISDVGARRFSHQARFAQSPVTLAGFPLNVNGWTLDHQDRDDTIAAGMDSGYQLRLQLHDGKPPALHSGGYITYGPAGGSYYYSRTRLSATGTLTTPEGSEDAVSGLAWMDHQWGNFVIAGRGGWDWYSLQLDDDTEYMLYVLRDASGATTAVYGSQVAADGHVDDLPAGAVLSEPTGAWTSPHTGAVYPSGWRLSLPDGRRLVVQPQLEDQELYFPGVSGAPVAYWEGAVTLSGDTSGVGYVELTGYAR